MKKIKSFLWVAGLLVTMNAAGAVTEPADRGNEIIRKAIGHYLKDNGMLLEEDQEILARIRLIVNSAGEIVVLEVESAYEPLSDLVKRRLNYRNPGPGLEAGRTYEVPIRITG